MNPCTACAFCIAGQSANNFRKSQIHKFGDLIKNNLDLQTFRKFGTLQICDLRTQSFCDLWICNLWICYFRTSAIRKYVLFLLTHTIEFNSNSNSYQIKKSLKNKSFWTARIQSCAVFCRSMWGCDLWITHENLQITDLRTGTL
jgi:hypothetical protein